jgi:hypothetical protein
MEINAKRQRGKVAISLTEGNKENKEDSFFDTVDL